MRARGASAKKGREVLGAAGPDAAVAGARAVVGLYGDPTISWSVVLEVEVARPVVAAQVSARARALVEQQPAFGRAPAVQRFPGRALEEVRGRFADTAYADHAPLLRIAVDEPGTTLVLAAHHGVVDALGLVATLNHLLGTGLTSEARGVSALAAGEPFLARAAHRLGEAVTRPPSRFRASPQPRTGGSRGPDPGDWLVGTDVSGAALSTASLVRATGRALQQWNHGSDRRPVVLAVGASRRTRGEPLRPDRATAYLRIELPDDATPEQVARQLRETLPEPDFPVTRGLGLGPLLTRALASRLGATALVSNLGRLADDGAVLRTRFWPAASGPCGVAVGLSTVGTASTLTVRARRTAFDRSAAESLLGLVRDGLAPGTGGDQ
ncbi:hypothetical protein [Nocardioides mesophilus]|uniref:Condensation domain-containing protein n=1 Tax=Nocardioides mesophilus TaxID=433659 RepID=A0A7G9RBR6_9ACTN|nr:hypothetical protein [Nocardioides mesophilus]QNN53041.1 hypothetical protein H9L09_00590 [Nocardioides mesophilus]